MPRSKSKTTIALEAISKKSGLGIKHLRELHRQGMPISSTQAAQNWLAERPDKSPASSSVEELRLQKIKLCRAQVEKAELDLDIRRGLYLSREENVLSDAKIAHAVAAMVKKLNSELPAICFGQHDRGKLTESIKSLTREIQQAVADGQAEYWDQHKLTEEC
jgi:phage terminase Nu1 subunit (DNA packaging protein)